ncbi:MAG: hypothetical protein ACLFSB_15125 [Chitinispirillaceae bacterium]
MRLESETATTRVFYLPFSLGLQRLLYGPADVEGIFAEYSLCNGHLDSLLFLAFEKPGHVRTSMSRTRDSALFAKCMHNNAPVLKIASWNHLFAVPDDTSAQKLNVCKFDAHNWKRLRMHRPRASIVKEYFAERDMLFGDEIKPLCMP